MRNNESQGQRLREFEELARGWGELLAREAYPAGPGLEVSLAEMEEVVAAACRGIVRGAVETMTSEQGEHLGGEAPCPSCGRWCGLERKPRPMSVRGGEAELAEPVGHCPSCRRDFFPSAAGTEGRRPSLQPDDPAPHPAHGQRDQFL